VVLLGLIFLAGYWERAGPWFKKILLLGLVLDYFLGVFLQVVLERLGTTEKFGISLANLSFVARGNWDFKNQRHLAFVGDLSSPLAPAILTVILLGFAFLVWQTARQICPEKEQERVATFSP
jgi:hypothetical protein